MQSLSFCLVLAAPFVAGLDISTNDPEDLSLAVNQVAKGVLSFYDGDEYGNTIGLFSDGEYYWWEQGAAWDTLVNYWYLTGDASHNAVVQAALDFQQGPDNNYMPPNQTMGLMNDDQATWALAAMTAAERDFPLAEGETPWEKRASNVFDNLAARWDTVTCDGGLRWGIFTFNSGYSYKNGLSQALFFQLAARLARFTGNQTYIDWASRTYDWAFSTGLIDPDTSAVYDGTSTTNNCSLIVHYEYTPLGASFAYGSAILANVTSNTTWSDRASSHLSHALDIFFPDNILEETFCEPYDDCDTDQLAYPALTLRWLALLPVFQPAIQPVTALARNLNATAVAAARWCTEDDDDDTLAECTNGWNEDSFAERREGLGQQLSALEALLTRYVVESDGGVNASVVLRTDGAVEEVAAGGNGTGSESANGTTTGGGGGAAATGASGAAGSVRVTWGPGVLVAVAFAVGCLL